MSILPLAALRVANWAVNAVLAGAMISARSGCVRRFRGATCRPMEHQQRVLQRILRRNADTVFGQRHGFASIRDIDGYRAQVPVTGYDGLKPYIDRQRTTGEAWLTAEAPVIYARTSGTTGEPKFLPVTPGGLRALRRIQRLVAHARHAGSGFHRGPILAVAGPASEGRFDSGQPYGSATGLIYASMSRLIRSKYVMPAELFSIDDYEARYYAIAALGLRERWLTGLAAANPSTFRKLISVIREQWDRLLADIAAGTCAHADAMTPAQRAAFFSRFAPCPQRAQELAALRTAGRDVRFADIWPDLQGVVTWTGGSCGAALASLADQWPPAARIIEAGYVASELWGSVNLDLAGAACVPTITDVFFEFVARDDHEAGIAAFRTLDQLETGRQYYVIVTTGDGLYRYDMNDIVTVTGRCSATPTIAFVRKGRSVASITGEKLHENQQTEALSQLQLDLGLSIPFFIALADEEAAGYRLYLEAGGGDLPPEPALAALVDRRLAELNLEYAAKRESGRLNPLQAFWLAPGTGDRHRQACVAAGQRDAQFKALLLQYRRDCRFDFERHRLQQG